MNRKQQRQALASRVVFVGCQFCGATDKTLRNYGDGKICPECLKRKKTVSNSGTGKGDAYVHSPVLVRRGDDLPCGGLPADRDRFLSGTQTQIIRKGEIR